MPTPFLDIDSLVTDIGTFDERGLLGLAFDPAFAENRRIYVNYTDLASDTHIRRYLVSPGNPNLVDHGTGRDLLVIDQPQANHNGGTLAFGPQDGYLYIGMGDGGGSGDPDERAQDPAELLGKMLRIDVSGATGYTIPPDNPFVGRPGWRPEIWDLGFRNPYRWSFDRATGDLWIGDVGQADWEEVDFEPAGEGGRNYGWDIMEGTHCYEPPQGCDPTGLVLPIHEYSHSGGHCSVTGGCVYRGADIAGLAGTYFFADYCSAKIWSFRYTGSGITEFTDRTAELAPGGGLLIQDIAAIGQDGRGEVYIVDRGNESTSAGEVYRVLPAGGSSAGDGAVAARDFEFRGIAPNPFLRTTALELYTARPGPVSYTHLRAHETA
ncbi:MAG: PQQ-dependent sugar dehydrogenase, partial [Candidatus Eisenbacteria bacterium]|nr:PQQ-dependent sugar dehydrogenase [Candidatus Eisenbacteria bacterium]